MADTLATAIGPASRQTNHERKADNRVEYAHQFGGRKARWMGSGVVPLKARLVARKRAGSG